MKDLIIGSIKDYDEHDVRQFIHSLTRTGYTGDRIMFADNLTPAAHIKLRKYGFQIKHGRNGDHRDFLERERFYEPIAFLKRHAAQYRYVIWCDVRDLVFQTNPSTWFEHHAGDHKLFGAGECVLIRNQSLNDWWVARGFDHDTHRWLRNEQVCCGGTLAGTADVMLDALSKVLELTVNGVNDQAALNYVLRTSPFKEIMTVPKMAEGFCCTCSQFLSSGDDGGVLTDEVPVFNKSDGVVYTPDGKTPFSIVHQVDRSGGLCDCTEPWWKDITFEKYKD